MKTLAIIIASLALGVAIWFWLFGLAFTRATTAFWSSTPIPLLACFILAGVLASVRWTTWLTTALCIASPSIILNLVFFLGDRASGGTGGFFIAVTSLVVATSLLGSVLGHYMSYLKQHA